MEVKVLYFGMIAEATDREEEIISLQTACTIYKLEQLLKQKYKNLQQLSFKIAVDKEILSGTTVLKSTNEIALLPPFSGG